jgi:hypothetical protein
VLMVVSDFLLWRTPTAISMQTRKTSCPLKRKQYFQGYLRGRKIQKELCCPTL